ncbi:hypothetical protein [Nocardia puris]|uniref:Uncharacterized protein n=1 Tax=Nocardia puris TaxID=208602 RepID=A0A366DIP4_9NOCA|nr:hypothetical protein [Nocardia puris]RBO89369.1 hypothetical protein DFR74_10746 [Nocardia puris]
MGLLFSPEMLISAFFEAVGPLVMGWAPALAAALAAIAFGPTG